MEVSVEVWVEVWVVQVQGEVPVVPVVSAVVLEELLELRGLTDGCAAGEEHSRMGYILCLSPTELLELQV